MISALFISLQTVGAIIGTIVGTKLGEAYGFAGSVGILEAFFGFYTLVYLIFSVDYSICKKRQGV